MNFRQKLIDNFNFTQEEAEFSEFPVKHDDRFHVASNILLSKRIRELSKTIKRSNKNIIKSNEGLAKSNENHQRAMYWLTGIIAFSTAVQVAVSLLEHFTK